MLILAILAAFEGPAGAASLNPVDIEAPRAFAQVRDGSAPAALLDLDGVWQFKATDEETWLEARVPSTVQTDLMRAGRLADPFFRDNELLAQWVEKKEWEYRRTFTVATTFLEHDRIMLECRGLDTIAEVYLNGSLVAKTQNMFIEHEFDVMPLLREGTNQVRVVFRSVLEWNRRQADAEPRVTWTGKNAGLTDSSKGLLFFSRKEASDFGWDWSPRILSCGIWKPIRLAAYDLGRITALEVRQDLTNPAEALLEVTAGIEAYRKADLRTDVEITLEGRTVARVSLPMTDGTAKGRVRISNPKLWWPNGWGEHPLYTVTAELRNGGELAHTRQVRIGLRTISLWREKDGQGETFGIRVNGKLIFCKGANWIPLDALPDRLTEAHYRQILDSCVDVNMNMLRIWGGGLYEPDVFYEYCDEHGILLWHDFMFAAGPYLAVPSYLENVRAEIENVVLRRRHHPSIALWCGNNEQESSMTGGHNWPARFPTVTWTDFDKVFYETIPEAAAQVDPDRPYWPGSPHHPLDRERKTPDWETSSGDTHDWDVWHGGKTFDWFKGFGQFRFVSEFGFESLPTMETIRAFTLPGDRFFNSYVLDHHEKTGRMTRAFLVENGNNRGTSRIARNVAALFPMPRTLDEWAYASQVLQGEGMRLSSEALRRGFPHSTGALYWQLGDNWPVISNSSIDYHGRWKAVHYMARRFFAPVLLSPVVDGTTVEIWAVNDSLRDVPATLEWTLSRFDGGEIKHGAQEVVLPANSSSALGKLSFAAEVGEDPEHHNYRNDSFVNASRHYLALRLVRGGREIASAVAFFAPEKYLQLPAPGIKTEVARAGQRRVVNVRAGRFAAFVELGLTDGYARFSDNYFHLLPGEERQVEIHESTLADEAIPARLYVRSLGDLR